MACAKIFDSVKVVCEYGSWPDLFLAALTLYPLFFIHAVWCDLFWFKRQGVSTLSLCEHTDGVL